MAYWILGGVMAVGPAVWFMLSRISARGGQRAGDAASKARSVLNQVSAGWGEGPERREPWDGVDRLKTGPVDPGPFGL